MTIDDIDQPSLKLMESIFAADQFHALIHAARIRRLVVTERMTELKAQKNPDPQVLSQLLGEVEKLERILGTSDDTHGQSSD